jgi:hypothetical protein
MWRERTIRNNENCGGRGVEAHILKGKGIIGLYNE